MTMQRDRTRIWVLATLLLVTACSEPLTPGIQISSADPVNGLRGRVTSHAGDDVLRFESKVTNGVLHATITDQANNVLAAYTEDGSNRPDLTINQIPYSVAGEPGFELALTELADHGDAIRTLAYDLALEAPSPDLVRERRGLEVPFQAAQTAIGVSPDHKGDLGDYYAADAIYVVKTLDPRLILQRNWMNPEAAHVAGDAHTDGVPGPDQAVTGGPVYDDESRVGSCFGRCGGGCGSWQHYTVNLQSTYLYSFDIENGGWCNVYSTTGETLHQTCGCATHGCASHDWCVRNLCGGDAGCATCWDVAIWAGISWTSCLFRGDTCWSYVDGTVSFPEDLRCFYCGSCGCAEGGPPSCDLP
jgi:hypothetical protein